MSEKIRQTKFDGGEIDPRLWSCSDLPAHRRGLRLLENFVPAPQGSLVKRPGLEWLNYSGGAARLIPFVFSDDQAYALMFLAGACYPLKSGAFISNGLGAEFFEHALTEADLPFIKYAQSYDVLSLACKGTAPQEVRRYAEDDWRLAAVDFTAPAFTTLGTLGALVVDLHTNQSVDSTHVAKHWLYAVTHHQSLPQGGTRETQPITCDAGATAIVTPDRPSVLLREFTQSPALPSGLFSVYRGIDGIWGWIGDVDVNPREFRFTDYGQAPNWDRVPPTGDNPFIIKTPTGTTLRTETPAVVAFHDHRRIFARTNERPGWFCASQPGDFSNFDYHSPAQAGDEVEATLASYSLQEIRSLVSLRRLLALTGAGEWAVSGPGGGALLGDQPPEAYQQSSAGASWLDPLRLSDSSVLFVQERGSVVRDLRYDQQIDSYGGNDLTVLAHHLLRGKTIKAWAYQQNPHSLVWIVLSDGTLVSLTYQRETGTVAWARHPVPETTFESICCVPEGAEDRVYFIANHNGVRSILRLGQFEADHACLDFSKAVTVAAGATSIGGLGHLNGRVVRVMDESGVASGPFTVTGGAVAIPAAEAETTFTVGELITSRFESLDLYLGSEGRTRRVTVVRAALDVSADSLTVAEDSAALSAGRGTIWTAGDPDENWGAGSDDDAIAELAVIHSHGKRGRLAVEHATPGRCEVYGLIREVDIGG